MLLEAHELLSDEFGPEHMRTELAVRFLLELYSAMDDPEELERWTEVHRQIARQ